MKTSWKKMLSNDSPVLKVSLKLMNQIQKTNRTKPGTTIGTKFPVLQGIRIPFLNEIWFLNIDPFIRISVFIAKLSERQYCWRVFEDFHSQKCIQFFDIHCCLFMRLHFSSGGYDYGRTARFRQSIHFSITQVLVADHVH